MRWAASLLVCGGLALAALASVATAREITPAEEREERYDTRMPLCHDPLVLDKLTERFAEKEARFWSSPLKLLSYENIRPVAWRPWGLDFIPRRFCTATVLVSDGKKRRVNYSVREELDLALIFQSFGVEWCVVGLDRNLAYAPHCMAARP